MSATFDEKKYMKYFDVGKENYIEITGLSNPIKSNFPKYTPGDYIKYAYDTAIKIHENNTDDYTNKINPHIRDIIMFVSGTSVLKKMSQMVNLYNLDIYMKNKEGSGSSDSKTKNYLAPVVLSSESFKRGGKEYYELYSNVNYLRIPICDSNKIIKTVTPSRRLIISTNVAETGVTIKTLKYCIDTGWEKTLSFNPDFGIKIMMDKNVSKGNAMQRKGRVGRTGPGEWFPCYTEEVFKNFAKDSYSEILTSDITDTLLKLIINETESSIERVGSHIIDGDNGACSDEDAFQIHNFADKSFYKINIPKNMDIQQLNFMDSPSSATLLYSLEKLYTLGFINQQCNPTNLGMIASLFKKISIENIRMMLSGYHNGANILDLITITSFLQVGQVRGRKYKLENIWDKKSGTDDNVGSLYTKLLISDEFVDFILLLTSFMEKLKTTKKNIIKTMEKFCQERDVNYKKNDECDQDQG